MKHNAKATIREAIDMKSKLYFKDLKKDALTSTLSDLYLAKAVDYDNLVSSWSNDGDDVHDLAPGLGSLHGAAAKYPRNSLLQPSVVRKDRMYSKGNKTYFMHPDGILPTVAGLGIVSATNSLPAIVSVMKLGRLWQTRRSAIPSKEPDEEEVAVKNAVDILKKDAYSAHAIQVRLPYKREDLIKASPAFVARVNNEIEAQLQSFGIPHDYSNDP